MWDWAYYGNPLGGMLVDDQEQRETMRQILDGMVRERSHGAEPAVLNNRVNIGIGIE